MFHVFLKRVFFFNLNSGEEVEAPGVIWTHPNILHIQQAIEEFMLQNLVLLQHKFRRFKQIIP